MYEDVRQDINELRKFVDALIEKDISQKKRIASLNNRVVELRNRRTKTSRLYKNVTMNGSVDVQKLKSEIDECISKINQLICNYEVEV